MLFHMLNNSMYIFKETHMTELIHFIMADRLHLHHASDLVQICLRCSKGSDTGAWEADL